MPPFRSIRPCITATCLALIIHADASGQDHQNTGTDPRLGIEIELIQPFIPDVQILTAKATLTVIGDPRGAHGDVMLGIFARPNISHDVVERITEYMGIVGYRQYLYRGLHVEAEYLAGYVWGENNLVNGRDYEGFVHFVDVNLGYRVDFGKRFYVLPQVGYLQGLNDEEIIGPRDGKDDAFVQGKLLVGMTF